MRRGVAAALLCVPLLAVLATGAAAQTVVPNDWPLKPAGLSGGDQFRLLFITSTTRDATATDIATYNSFVQTAAAGGHASIRSYSSQFRVLGSTATVDARDNTSSTGTGVPIYWLGGAKVADNYADFYDGSWDSTALRDESGGSITTINHFTWTGSNNDGTKSTIIPGRGHLGHNAVVVRADRGLYSDFGSPSNTYPFFALSPVFEVGAAGASASVSDATVAERSGIAPMRFTVSLSEAVSHPVTVRVLTVESSPRSARWRRDFRPIRRDLTFRPGETEKAVEVHVLPDGFTEGPETFELRILSVDGAAIGDRVGIGTITDEAVPGVSVSRASFTMDEAGTAAAYTVALDAAPPAGGTVTVTATPGDTAALRVNGGTSAALRFTSTNWNRPQTVTVTALEDADTDDASVTVTHAVSGGGTAWSSVTAPDVTVKVTDRIPPSGDPEANFALASSSAGEGAGTATVRVTLSHAQTAALTLSYRVEAESTATATADYGFLTGTVTVPAGQIGADISVPITDDSANEPDETVVLTLLEGSIGNNYTLGSTDEHTLTITDNDDPPPSSPSVSIAPASDAAVAEGGSASFTLTASRAPATDLAVTVSVSDAADRDFVAAADEGTKTVTILAGQTTATLTVATDNDAVDEPDGRVTAAVLDGDGYRVGASSSAERAVTDGDPTTVTLTAPAGALAEDEGSKLLTVALGRKLVAGETLDVPVTLGGTATNNRDYELRCWDEYGVQCRYVGSPGGLLRFTGGDPRAKVSVTLRVQAFSDREDEGTGETVTVGLGSPTGNLSGGATVSAAVSIDITDDDDPLPVVTITGGSAVTEGTAATFTVTRTGATAAALAVSVDVSDEYSSDFLAQSDEGRKTVTIAAGAASATLTVPTQQDSRDEPNGFVRASLAHGAAYARGDPPAATVAVSDDDATTRPTLSIADATQAEGAGVRAGWPAGATLMPFTVTLSAAQRHTVQVWARTRDSAPVSARGGHCWGGGGGCDYLSSRFVATFYPGQTERRVYVRIVDDSHDEGPETFEVVLYSPRGAVLGDAVAVGTIVNDDPMPAAYLARFGRTVAQQALEGIAGRMAADRTPGMQGALAGQAVGFNPAASNQPSAGATPETASAEGSAALAMAEIARSFGNDAGHSGHGGAGNGSGYNIAASGTSLSPQSRTMTAREALLGSSFSLTGATDGAGGSMAFWGRASQGSFDGREGTFSLDGTVTTGMLGADYAKGRWLVGLALTQSEGEGDYRDTDLAPRPDEQTCPEDAGPLCDGAVRTGDGKVEASLTAAIPYAAFQASDRLKLWGAAGYGAGEVTLKTALGGNYKADTSWTMAAAGMRGDVLQAPAEGSGPALAVTSDALWARTSSEKTRDLAASESDVTRLRVGLEGSYRVAMEDGGTLVPKLEVGARHDGGDAETGFGVELGGGIKWTDPSLGLSLDLSGRTLIAHGNDDLKDRGYSAALAYDPAPATKRGASLSLRQDFGGRAEGGLDALFQPDPLDDRTGGGEATSRWALEAAYGLPAFGGRWTGSPHVGFGLATGSRDYSLGWRLTPEAANAPDLSFGVKATRRENDTQAAEHTVGLELTARW